MVKKLFKYEMLYYLKSLLPYFILVPSVALLNRLLQFFSSDTAIYDVLYGSSTSMYIISIMVCLVMVTVTTISRFHKNLFSSEGYLTMTLPVTESAHILVKLFTSVVFAIISVIVVLLSACVISSGELLVEFFKAFGYITNNAFETYGFDLILLVIEFIILIIAAYGASILLYYGCISIGQLAKKNRVLCAFGAYFAHFVISQLLASAFAKIIESFPELIETIGKFMEKYLTDIQQIHLILWVTIIAEAVISTIYFFVSRFIIKRKLNLE